MQSQFLQLMQTGPLGGEEALRDDDDRRRRHNERVFKTMTEEELALERLEVNEVVRKLEENRMYTSRDVAPRKAWGSAKPSEDSWRRWTGAPRSGTGVVGATQRRGDDQGATMRSTARSAVSYGTQGYAARPAPPPAHRAPVPDFGAVTDNWASSAPAGGAPPAAESAQYIRTLEAKVAELSETVDTLRKSQELPTGVAAGASVAPAVPEQFAGQVEVLKERYRDNLGRLKAVYTDKKTLEEEKRALERRVRELEQGAGRTSAAPASAAAASEGKSGPAPVVSVAKKKAKIDRIRRMAAASRAEEKGEESKGAGTRPRAAWQSEGKSAAGSTAASASRAPATSAVGGGRSAGADIHFDMTLMEEDDIGGDEAGPPGMDDESEGGDENAPPGSDEEDEALDSTILHGKGATGGALSTTRAAAAPLPKSKWGLEPEDTVEFTRRTRAKYLDNDDMYSGSRAAATSGAAGSVSKSSASRGFGSTGHSASSSSSLRKGARKRTVQRPFVSMEMRSDKDSLGITERKRLAEEKRRKEEEEAMLNFRFKHRKIPKSTTDAKYEQLLEEQAIRRKANVDKRKEELEAMKAEFSGVQERTAKAAARWEARKKELEAKKEEEVVQEHFKANPVPKYLRKGNRAAELEAAERLRKERIKQRAAQNLNKSKLPKRMEMWEKKQKEAKARKAKEDKRKHRRGSRGNVPKVNTKVPDFDKLKSSWNKTMANARAKFKPTKPQSFSFDSQERKAAAEKKKRDLQMKLLREQQERTRPIKATPIPASSRRSSDRPMSKMTNAARKRLEHVQQMRREKEEREIQAKLEEAARKQKVKQASRELRPVIASMEKGRLKQPLAWQQKKSTIIKAEKRAAAARPSPSTSSLNGLPKGKRKPTRKAKQGSRTFLFSQSAIQASQDKAYYRTLLKLEKAADDHGSSSSDTDVEI